MEANRRIARAAVLLAGGMLAGTMALAQASTAGAAPASPAAGPPPPAEVFFTDAGPQQAVLSPSGLRMALRMHGGNGRVGVFVVDLQGSDFTARRAALFADADVSTFEWVDDERLVFSLTDLQSGLGEDQRRAPGLFAVRHDGSGFKALVATQGEPVSTSRVERVFTLPWNHGLLHVPTAPEDGGSAGQREIIVGEWSFSGNDLRHIAPLWQDTDTGRTRRLLVDRVPCSVRQWWFNAPGEPRAVLCQSQGRDALHWYTPPREGQPGSWRLLAEAPMYELPFTPLWVGEGDKLYVSHAAGAAGEEVVARFDFAKGAPGEPLVTAPGFDFRGRLIGDPQGRRLLGVRLHTDAEQTLWFDAARKAAQERADAALPGRVNQLQCRRCGRPDAVMLVRSYSDQDPGRLALFRQADDGGRGRWQLVGRARPDIRPEAMARTELERIRARDGRDLPVWLTRKPGTQGALPAVVLVHGGPWLRGRYWMWEALPQFLASRGWLVIEPEFRGSDGYGRDHLRAGFRQWGQAMQDDVADALLWARRQGLAGDAACIVGGSYGGYSTLMGLIRHPELYRCGSAWVAVTDPFLYLEGAWWLSDDISDSGRRWSLPQRVGHPEQDREMLLANSPVAQAHRIRTPLQLVWGGEDQRVPITHGKRLREAMEKAGQQPEWIVYADEAHGWRRAENQIDFAKRLEAFLARHLGPVPAGR